MPVLSEPDSTLDTLDLLVRLRLAYVADKCLFAVMYMIFDLLMFRFELFISETSDCVCYFLRKENHASLIECYKLAFLSAEPAVLPGCYR